MKRRLKKIIKLTKKYYGKAKRMLGQIFIIIFNRIFCLLPLQNKRVLFISDVREDIGDGNLAYMYDYLPEEYNKVTSFISDRRIKRTLKEKIRLIYNLSVSKYILLDDFCAYTSYMKVRKNQELVQLWHGPGAYKKFGHSRAKDGGDLKNVTVHPGYKRYTKAIVSSEDIRSCYAEAFSISIDKVGATGFPRTDMFFNKKVMKEKKAKIEKKYPFLKNKKIIVFAPTYRGTRVNDANYDFDKLDLDEIYKKYKDEYVFIFKWHPALYNNILNGTRECYDLEKYNGFYQDLSSERDINELLLVADILITDYSSVIFDWAFLNKPIIYFAYDKKEYETGRGLYFPFDEYIYGEVATDTKELIKSIEKANLCKEKREKFIKKFLSKCDGKSTQRTYEWIFEGKKDEDDN